MPAERHKKLLEKASPVGSILSFIAGWLLGAVAVGVPMLAAGIAAAFWWAALGAVLCGLAGLAIYRGWCKYNESSKMTVSEINPAVNNSAPDGAIRPAAMPRQRMTSQQAMTHGSRVGSTSALDQRRPSARAESEESPTGAVGRVSNNKKRSKSP